MNQRNESTFEPKKKALTPAEQQSKIDAHNDLVARNLQSTLDAMVNNHIRICSNFRGDESERRKSKDWLWLNASHPKARLFLKHFEE